MDKNDQNNQKIETNKENSQNTVPMLFFAPCGENDLNEFSNLNRQIGKEFVKSGKYRVKK